MRHIFIIIFILLTKTGYTNMASPVTEGTLSSSAFSSRDIDILKEKIHITVDKNFKTANYVVEYHIKTEVSGKQIPLLFYAKDYIGDFKVWINNHEVKLSPIPHSYKRLADNPFKKFSQSSSPPFQEGEPEEVTIYWEHGHGIVYKVTELKYFDVDIEKGEHIIRVEYKANVWEEYFDWVTKYNFRYSLSPAKHWKSFGSLEVILDASNFDSPISSNLGKPEQGSRVWISRWHFSNLPAEFLEIYYTPQISNFANFLIAIHPVGLALIFGFLCALLHYFSIKTIRKRNYTRKYSWVLIIGSVLIPFLTIIFYVFSFDFIDFVIGNYATGRHGYTFLSIIFYPFLFIIYYLIMWIVDRNIKKRLISQYSDEKL
ncbi:MAG: hypothetical protein ACXWDO_07835 [Bacteroidia bacterium]